MGRQVEGGTTEAQHCLSTPAGSWNSQAQASTRSPGTARCHPRTLTSSCASSAWSSPAASRPSATPAMSGPARSPPAASRSDNGGKETWVPIRIDRLTRTGQPGAHRWYQEPTIACPTNDEHTPACLLNRCLGDHDGCTPGGHPYRLPLVQTHADTDADFRRSEYARQFPPDTKGYARTYDRRPPGRPTTPSAGSDTPGSASPPTATTSRACWRTARADGTTSGSTHTTRPPPDQDDPASTTARRVTTTPDHPESGSSGGLAKCCPDPPGTGRAPGILTTGESEQQQLFITPVNRPVRRATWTRASEPRHVCTTGHARASSTGRPREAAGGRLRRTP